MSSVSSQISTIYSYVNNKNLVVHHFLNKDFFTQNDMLQLLSRGYYSKAFIGSDVQLNNSKAEGPNMWYIIDFEHEDYPGSGKASRTYDLSAYYPVRVGTAFDTASEYNYMNSPMKTWMNDTFYNGFDSSVRDKMRQMQVVFYNKAAEQYIDQAYVKPMSAIEWGCKYVSNGWFLNANEGTAYPIIKRRASSISIFLRSKYAKNNKYVIFVKGFCGDPYYVAANTIAGYLPVIRLG